MSPTGAPMDAIEEEFLQAVDALQQHLTILRLRRKGKPKSRSRCNKHDGEHIARCSAPQKLDPISLTFRGQIITTSYNSSYCGSCNSLVLARSMPAMRAMCAMGMPDTGGGMTDGMTGPGYGVSDMGRA